MWVPGFGSEDLRPYKKAVVTDAHKQVGIFFLNESLTLYPILLTRFTAFHHASVKLFKPCQMMMLMHLHIIKCKEMVFLFSYVARE